MEITAQFRKQFKTLAVAWLNHKMILSEKSFHYKKTEQTKAIQFVKHYFGEFMKAPAGFSSVKLSRLLLKNEEKMRMILPSKENPSYINSENILNDIINRAREILNYEYQTENQSTKRMPG